MEPSTGKILSLIGGYDFFLNKYNRATQSIRQPGSNIKPFIYSASLDQGFTPASLVSGSSIVITDPAHGTLWRPENYSGKFFGPTRIREALGKSMNLVSIRLLRAIGIPYAREYVERFGIDMNRFSASLTMDREGNTIFIAPKPEFCDQCYSEFLPKPEPIEVAPEEIDLVDQTIEPLEEIEDPLEIEREQENLPDLSIPRNYEAPRVMSHANNFLTVSMMKDVIKRGTARRALALNRQDLAGKTGTTNDYIDAWFTGFNSQVATTVWVGFNNPKSMGRGEAGSLTALPIWVDYMKAALEGIKEDSSELPEYIEAGFVNRNTGRRTDEQDPDATPELFTINELTPEYALIQSLYSNDEQLAAQDNLTTEAIGEFEELADELDEQLDELPIELDQSDRIIEESEDTEGLF